MPQERSTSNNIIADHNQLSRFIDPYSDFGFKHLFGKAPNRDFLIKFLNGVFKGRKVIVDIEYNKRIRGDSIIFEGKGSIRKSI